MAQSSPPPTSVPVGSDYPLPTTHYPLFTLRTPTALLTAPGAEFGVEVGREGNTSSYVLCGLVRIQTAGGEGQQRDLVLHENDFARVEKSRSTGAPRLLVEAVVGNVPAFARRIGEPPKLLDLLDIVAGGDGTGQRRERGIDPATGKEIKDTLLFTAEYHPGRGRFQPLAWQKLIDGVFVPDNRGGAVQLDSAGHVFDGFPRISGGAAGMVWSREASASKPKPAGQFMFMPEGGAMLLFRANAGLTFDIQTMRKTYPDLRAARFRAIAGVAKSRRTSARTDSLADLWVFVDGRLKLKRTQVRPQDGTVDVDIELGAGDRFLTLVSTNGQNGFDSDWVVFGNPVLEMAAAESENRKEGQPMKQ